MCLVCCVFFVVFALGLDAFAKVRQVRVGYDPGYGNVEESAVGRPSGYGYEYLTQLAQFTDWQYQFVSCDWNMCLRMLEKGELDMVPGMQRTAAREKIYDFADERQGFEYATLLALAGNDNVYFDDPAGYAGLRVGLVRNNAVNSDLDAYLLQHKVQVERVFYESVEASLAGLVAGNVDLIAGSSTLKGDGMKVVAHLGARAFYVGVSRHARGVLDTLNQAQRTLSTQDVYYAARLHEKHSLIRTKVTSFSREEARVIRESPPLRVAVHPNWWPVESYEFMSALPRGIMPDILTEMMRQLGLNLHFVRTASYEDSVGMLERGEVDIITGVTGGLEKTLPGLVNVSLPLFRLPLLLVSKGDVPRGGQGKNVAVPRFFDGIEPLRANFKPQQLVFYDRLDEAGMALKKGDTPLALMSAWRFDSLLREPGFGDLRVVSLLPSDTEVALGVATHLAPQLLTIINKSVQSLDRTVVNTAILRHTTQVSGPRWDLLWRVYGWWLAPGFLLLGIVGLSLALVQKSRTTQALRRVALTDEVTGMGNQKAFVQKGLRLCRQSRYALVSMDINNFKNFNAYYGHQAGNVVLCRVARELQHFMEADELACRLGGDEFALLLQWPESAKVKDKELLAELDATALEKVLARLEALRQIIAAPLYDMDNSGLQQRIKLSFSFGVFALPAPGTSHGFSLESAVDSASLARKSAKEGYKSTFGVYDAAMHQRVTDERLFEQEMLGAQARGEFSVRLQPKYDVHDASVVGAEALVRWDHPRRGEIQPARFVGLFERNGFITKIDMHVLDFVCRLLRRWLDEGRKALPISVNMSRLHVLDSNFAQSVKQVLSLHQVPPPLIELEVTETAFLDNSDILPELLQELSEFGVRLSMDDFGTGYSSLNMLKNIPVHGMKLDKAFLASKDTRRSRDIIRHMVGMAHDLNMDVVCEGVETAEQVDFLRTTSCRVAQGFYFAKPMTAATFEHLVFGDLPDALVNVPRHEQQHK